MRAKRLIPILITAACSLGAVPAGAAAATTSVQQASSGNWSGYVAGGSTGSTSFSSVSGSWVAPVAKCASASGYAAFWVGLGGSGQSQSLEQAGTEADCASDGTAKYFAWYELVPSAPVRLGLTITPGDQISSRVSVSGTQVTIDMTDHTSGQSATKVLTMDNPDTSSAEWIAEAPSRCAAAASNCQPLPLTDFGSVKFTNTAATSTDGHTGPISDSDWTATAVSLQAGAGGYGGASQFASDPSSSAGATPSSLSTDGGSFSVAYSADPAAVSSSGGSSGSAGGYGGGYGNGYGGNGYGGGYGAGYPDGYGNGYGYGYGYGDPGYGGAGYGDPGYAGGGDYGGYGVGVTVYGS